jgi:uncharacterized membrane protein YdjX (TVP38/TMEM64 family)
MIATRDFLNRNAVRIRRVSAAILVLSLAILIWLLPMQALVESLRARVERLGSGGPAAFAAVFVGFTICCLPVWPLPFLAGALFGTVRGTMVASASCVLAAAVTFLTARGLRRTLLRRFLERSPRVQALEQTVDAADWKIVAAVRLSHFLPFGVQNYAFGLTRISIWTFTLTTWLVTLPGLLLQVHLGHLGFTSVAAWREASLGDWQQWAWQLAALAFFAMAATYIAYVGRSAYRRVVQSQLEARLHAVECRAGECHRWPIGTIVLGCVATVVLAAAVWSCLEHDTLQAALASQVAATHLAREATR